MSVEESWHLTGRNGTRSDDFGYKQRGKHHTILLMSKNSSGFKSTQKTVSEFQGFGCHVLFNESKLCLDLHPLHYMSFFEMKISSIQIQGSNPAKVNAMA